MIPPQLRLPLSSLAAFALGVGLTAAWFQVREPGASAVPVIEKVNHSDSQAARNGTNPHPTPWKTKSNPTEARNTPEPPPTDLPEDEETIRRELRAQIRHQARVEAHEFSARLGLDPVQTEQFLAAKLQDAETRIEALDPKPWHAWWVDVQAGAWLKENLTAQQKETYKAYQRHLLREEAEQHALTETNGIARAIQLTEEQRAALMRKFAETHISIGEFSDFIHFGEPIDMLATSFDGPTTVVITESRIEMPVFSDRRTWLSDILSEDQLATYREFQAQQRELERLMQEEMRAPEEE